MLEQDTLYLTVTNTPTKEEVDRVMAEVEKAEKADDCWLEILASSRPQM